MEPIYVPRGERERKLQRALLQFDKVENWPLVREALIQAGREDLLGKGPDCLIPDRTGPEKGPMSHNNRSGTKISGTKQSRTKKSEPRPGGGNRPELQKNLAARPRHRNKQQKP
jgi:hypothetical protein